MLRQSKGWEDIRARLRGPFPSFTSWNLAVHWPWIWGRRVASGGKSNGQFLCQHGIAMDDVKSLMCDGDRRSWHR